MPWSQVMGDWAKGERGIAVLGILPVNSQGIAKAITYAQALGCPQVNCLAGIAPAGADRKVLEDVFAENLAFAAEKLEQAGIRIAALQTPATFRASSSTTPTRRWR